MPRACFGAWGFSPIPGRAGFARSKKVEFFVNRTRPELLSLLQPFLTPECSLLDVGCGPGVFVLSLARQLPRGRVSGIDGSQAMVDGAMAHAAEQRAANVDFRKGDTGALPPADG